MTVCIIRSPMPRWWVCYLPKLCALLFQSTRALCIVFQLSFLLLPSDIFGSIWDSMVEMYCVLRLGVSWNFDAHGSDWTPRVSAHITGSAWRIGSKHVKLNKYWRGAWFDQTSWNWAVLLSDIVQVHGIHCLHVLVDEKSWPNWRKSIRALFVSIIHFEWSTHGRV